MAGEHPFSQAAFRHRGTGQVIPTGSCHDLNQLPCGGEHLEDYDDGFVDGTGNFYTRDEARNLASDVPLNYDGNVLHSEDLFLSESFFKSLKDYVFDGPEQDPVAPSQLRIKARHQGKVVGELTFAGKANSNPNHPYHQYHLIAQANVHPLHRGNGLYGRLIQLASDHVKRHFRSRGVVSPGEWRSEKATAAWMRLADKLKGVKSRPGKEPDAPDFFLSSKDVPKPLQDETDPEFLTHEFKVMFQRWLNGELEFDDETPFSFAKAESALTSLAGDQDEVPPLSDDAESIAAHQAAPDLTELPEFKAAHFLVGGARASEEAIRVAMTQYADDTELAALRAYGLPRNEHYRGVLRQIMDMQSLRKAEIEVAAIPREIKAANAEAEAVTEAVRRAYAAASVQEIKLDGKHSKGTAVATDPESKDKWLLKPGSGKMSPSQGVSEEPQVTQSAREACAYDVATLFGINQYLPEARLLFVDDNEVAAMSLLATSYESMEKLQKERDPRKILAPYLQNLALPKWAAFHWIIGNPDCHANNIMVDGDDVKLIDHGSAFAGVAFAPAQDPKSFIPFYLRAWAGDEWATLDPFEKQDAMPSLSRELQQEFSAWLDSIDEAKFTRILTSYGFQNTQPMLARLQQLRAPGPLARWEEVTGLWSGVLSQS
jgi:hypothetical protein